MYLYPNQHLAQGLAQNRNSINGCPESIWPTWHQERLENVVLILLKLITNQGSSIGNKQENGIWTAASDLCSKDTMVSSG